MDTGVAENEAPAADESAEWIDDAETYRCDALSEKFSFYLNDSKSLGGFLFCLWSINSLC